MKVNIDKKVDFTQGDGDRVSVTTYHLTESNKLLKYIKKVENKSKKSVLIANGLGVPELKSPFASIFRDEKIWVFIHPERAFEHDIAHELSHSILFLIDKIPKIPIDSPRLTNAFHILKNTVQDFIIDKRLEILGFDRKESAKRDLKVYSKFLKRWIKENPQKIEKYFLEDPSKYAANFVKDRFLGEEIDVQNIFRETNDLYKKVKPLAARKGYTLGRKIQNEVVPNINYYEMFVQKAWKFIENVKRTSF
jgi:hypothetical protein